MRFQGTIIAWFPRKGYGFVRERGETIGDVFLHAKQILCGEPHEGATVVFEKEVGGRTNRLRATKAEVRAN